MRGLIAATIVRVSRSSARRSTARGLFLAPSQLTKSCFSSDATAALAKTSRDGVVGHPIDFDVHSKVEGNESQIVTVTLEPGQVLRAEVRSLYCLLDSSSRSCTF